MADEKIEQFAVGPDLTHNEPACIEQRQKTKLLEEEFAHTRKRLARLKVAPLLQFCVFAYNCKSEVHGEESDPFHCDYSSQLANIDAIGVPHGLQSTIAALEHLLSALKSRQS